MTKLTGFLYGHYDSRGGSAFVVADTREEADKKYAATVFAGDEDVTYAEQDFLGTANLETDEDLQNIEDLDAGGNPTDDTATLWVKSQPGHYELRYTKPTEEGPAGFLPSELGEDAFGTLLIK